MCEALTFLLDNINIKFVSKLYRQIVGILIITKCAPIVADLFLFCYERDFMLSLSDDTQSDVIEAFNSTYRYLDDLLNIDNNFLDSTVNRIYPSELQFNKANVSYRGRFFWIYIYLYRMVLSRLKFKINEMILILKFMNFPFLDGDVPRSTSYSVYISKLIECPVMLMTLLLVIRFDSKTSQSGV